jgi:hypothetical protein
MPLFIPEGSYQVSFHHLLASINQEAVITLGLTYGGSNFPVAAGEVEQSYVDNLLPFVNIDWHLVRINWQAQLGSVRDTGLDEAGGDPTAGTAPQIAAIIRKVTGQPGRKNRGRIYFPALAESYVNGDGSLSAGAVVAFNNGFVAWHNDISLNNFLAVILHNVAALPGGVDDEPTVITGFACQPRVGTQRRRLR